MSWAVLLHVLQVVIVLGALATALFFAVVYATEGETDAWGERTGPPHPLGIVAWGLLGLVPWLPFLQILCWGD